MPRRRPRRPQSRRAPRKPAPPRRRQNLRHPPTATRSLRRRPSADRPARRPRPRTTDRPTDGWGPDPGAARRACRGGCHGPRSRAAGGPVGRAGRGRQDDARARPRGRAAVHGRPRGTAVPDVPGLPSGRARRSPRPPSARTGRSGSPGGHGRTGCQVPRRQGPDRRAAAHAGRGRRPRRDHRGRRPDERGRPVGSAQDARGTAGRRDHHPVRRRRGSPAADRPVALLPGPPRPGRPARHRGDRRGPRPGGSTDRRPPRPARRADGPGSRSRMPVRPTRSSSGPS